MSCSSSEARPTHQAARTFIVILFALVLAALSMSLGAGEEQASPAQAREISISKTVEDREVAPAARGLFVSPSSQDSTRRYHPAVQTSDSAGALGFWMLLSLCGLFLAAAMAPAAMQRFRTTRNG